MQAVASLRGNADHAWRRARAGGRWRTFLNTINVAPEAEADFNAWYDEEHQPALARPRCPALPVGRSWRWHAPLCGSLSSRIAGGDKERGLEGCHRNAVERACTPAFPRPRSHLGTGLRSRSMSQCCRVPTAKWRWARKRCSLAAPVALASHHFANAQGRSCAGSRTPA